MDAAGLREQSVAELQATLDTLRKEQFQQRMQRSVGQLGQPHLLAEVRRNIARVKTVINEKQAAAHGSGGRGRQVVGGKKQSGGSEG